MDKDIIETRGAAALQRLYQVACGHLKECRPIAAFLLGLYNGERFPFDLTDLRAIDDVLFDDCMMVLRMDARVMRQEVHDYFDGGTKKFETLAENWAIEDAASTRIDAKRAAQPEGTPAPLHDGGRFYATLSTYGDAPGYQDVTLYVRCGPQENTEVALKLTPADGESVLLHIASVHALAWRKVERGPLDRKATEQRPAWLDRAPTEWAGS